MSSAIDTSLAGQAQAAPPAPAKRVRPFYWSVRRELWENHAIWIAPLAVAAVVILGFSVSLFSPHSLTMVDRSKTVTQTTISARKTVTTTEQGAQFEITANAANTGAQADPQPPPAKVVKPTVMTSTQRLAVAVLPYDFVAFAMLVTMFLVAVFYCLGAMHNERRDRSILFWKSLPVPDLTTVLGKAFIPLVVLPLLIFVITIATQVAMIVLNSIEWVTQGRSLAPLLERIPLGEMSVVLFYGICTLVLWWAPVYGWLLLVSVWARRAPFLWAVLPPLALALCEKLAFDTSHVLSVILSRLGGTYEEAFDAVHGTINGSSSMPKLGIEQIDAGKFLTTPGLWIGLVFAAGFLAASVWLRRNREPL